MPQNTPVYRAQLAREGRHAELFQALEEVLQANPDHPGLLYDAGLSAYRSEKFAEAADYLRKSKAQAPQDLRARAKLVQVYETLESFGCRDAEREELLALVGLQKDDPNRPANYCRDQFAVGDWAVQVVENFELVGDMAVRYSFFVIRAGEKRPAYRISLGTCALTNQHMRESGRLQPEERVFHHDEYRAGGHRLLGFFKGEPPYKVIEDAVLEILRQTRDATSEEAAQ